MPPSRGSARPAWARRNPRLLFRFVGSFLFRLAARTLSGLLFQEPPRFTRRDSSGLRPPPLYVRKKLASQALGVGVTGMA